MSGWPKRRWGDSFGGFGRQLAEQAGDSADRWRDRASTLFGRWRRLPGGERWNVALYVLTAVSMMALTVEFLAGPDTMPAEVTSAPAPIGSSGLTPVLASSTTLLTLPPATELPAAPQGPPTTGARQPAGQPQANPQPTQPAPPPTDPPATDPPVTQPPQTAPPSTKPPATIPTTGFTVVPPVLPTFPSNVPAGGTAPPG